MQVLTTLAGQPGEVVTRDEIRAAVWPDVSVGEDVLIRAVGEIRRAFGDDVRSPRIIQTIPKVGYRLIAAVSTVQSSLAVVTAADEPSPVPKIAPILPEINASGSGKHRLRLGLAICSSFALQQLESTP